MFRRTHPLIAAGAAVLLLAAFGAFIPAMNALKSVSAAPLAQETSTPGNMSISDETCLSCHNQPNLTMTLENGELFGLFIPAELYGQSIHGQKGYACVQCHTSVGNYPHPPFTAADARDLSLKLYPACQRCHASQYELVQDSVHATALTAGNRDAAICTDCHTAHAVRQLNDPETRQLLPEARLWIPQTCARCHYAIYQRYSTSVHGSALLGEGNLDVPTCIDCHGVHSIENPTTAAFRLRSPEICAKCHTDPQIMDKYGISTQVLDTYVADFHGTTVTLFEKQHPDQETNKPVCYDCHGVHDIRRTDDPEKGLQVRENLLARCQVCHPAATENFPTAWLSHYIPSPDRNPLVFTVDTFYKFFIPGLLGGMAILVILDVGSGIRKRFQRREYEPKPGTVGVFQAPEHVTSQPDGMESSTAHTAPAEESGPEEEEVRENEEVVSTDSETRSEDLNSSPENRQEPPQESENDEDSAS